MRLYAASMGICHPFLQLHSHHGSLLLMMSGVLTSAINCALCSHLPDTLHITTLHHMHLTYHVTSCVCVMHTVLMQIWCWDAA